LKKVGIALGGGGAKGMAHIAFLEKLDENNINVSAVSGTSMGAVIGALYCSGLKACDIYDKFRSLDEHTSTGRKRRLLMRFKTAGTKRRISLVKQFLEYIMPVKTFEELKIPLKICAVDFHSLEEKMFDSGNLIDAIIASIALPTVILPYKIDDRYYIDGGCLNVLPANYIRDDCDVLIGVDVSSINQPYHLKKPTIRNAHLAFEAATYKACFEYKLSETKVDLLYRLVFDKISTLDFFKYEQAYETGVKYASDFIERLNKKL
jgi:NTE family protein